MSKQLSENCIYFINMLRALIHRGPLPALPEGLDHSALYSVAEAQGLSCMVYHGLYELGFDKVTEPAATDFRTAHRAYVKHAVMQELEFNRFAAAMDTLGIDYMPLKGWFTRELYPDTVMRYMGDIDVLIRPEDNPRMYKTMLSMGYACDDYGMHESDNYRKGNMVFEVHYALDSEGVKDPTVYADPFASAEDMGGHCRRMSPSDAYLYTVVHGMKHFMNSGTGLRTLLDIYLYIKSCDLDNERIEKLAARMGVGKFLHAMQRLAIRTFGTAEPIAEGELSEDDIELLNFMLRSGSGGHTSTLDLALLNRSGHGGKGGSKASYLFRMIFPTLKDMQKRDKALRKHPWLLPVMYVRRWFQLLFGKRERIKNGIGRYNAIDDEAVEELRNVHRLAGLE